MQPLLGETEVAFDAQFDVEFGIDLSNGVELTDEEFLAAACGAVADILDRHDAPDEEDRLSNEEIFDRLRGVFDATSERFSADLAGEVRASMRVMEAIGHAACGNHELVSGAQQRGLLSDSVVEEHASHDHNKHESAHSDRKTNKTEDKKAAKKKKKKRSKR